MPRPPFAHAPMLRGAGLIALAFLGAACSGEPSGPPVPKLIKITADTTSILVGDSVPIVASVVLSNGKPSTQTLTWSSSNTAVLTVTSAGVAVGVADGSAVVTASLGSISASVTRKAYALKATPQLKLTGTALTVTSTPEQIAAGAMSVTRAASAPVISVGDVLVGKTSGETGLGYMRKVTTVSGTGTTQSLQTVQAKITEAYEDLSVESTVQPNAGRALRAAYLKSAGTDQWLDGVSVTPSGEIRFVQVPLGVSSTLSSGPASATVSLTGNVRLDFDQFLFALRFKKKLLPPSIELKEFQVIPSIRFGSTMTASATVTGNFASMIGFSSKQWTLIDKPIGTYFAGPIPFTVSAKLIAYVTPFANFQGTVSQQVNVDYGIQAGVWYTKQGGWLPISTPYGNGVTVSTPALNVGGSLGVTVGIVPQIDIAVGGIAGPYVGVDINAKAEMGLKNNGLSWFYGVDWGGALRVGAAVEVFGFELANWSTDFALGGRSTILGDGGAAARVTMAPSSVAMKVGASQALTPTVTSNFAGIGLPAGTFNCASSNTTVATVSGCTVTGRAVGAATVTATSSVEPKLLTTVPVTIQAAGPYLRLSTTSLTAIHYYSQTACPQVIGTVRLTNISTVNVNWSATKSTSMMSLVPSSAVNIAPNGTSDLVVYFTCDQAASWTGTITVSAVPSSGGTAETYTINVSLTVNVPLAQLPLRPTHPGAERQVASIAPRTKHDSGTTVGTLASPFVDGRRRAALTVRYRDATAD